MRSFFKMFFASLLAITIFSAVVFLISMVFIGGLLAEKDVRTGAKAVLYIDLGQPIPEQTQQNPFAGFSDENSYDFPGLYDVVKMIEHAKGDSSVKGIYLKCNGNPNGMATNEELRNALADFKSSKKFIYAYADVYSQSAYNVASVANKIYCNPMGGVDWKGFAVQYVFFKQALNKLEIEPQIFYAGKFKSATEPFREEKMSDANRLQTIEMLNDLYGDFLLNTSKARGLDTALLHQYAADYTLRTAADAVTYKLVDAAKYDDEVKEEIKNKLGLGTYDKINFVPMGKYAKAVNFRGGKGNDRVAVIFATGEIVDGKGDQGQIGGETFRGLIRKARLDKQVKAIVIRVNSGGGSAMASEHIWREITVAREDKPVVVSFGDYAASGGYYLACNADSIFTQANTITGSIGVFTILPNMQNFFKNKLGVTFDGVETSEHADALSAVKPLSETEKRFFQKDVDTIYRTFLTRVSNGRKLSIAYVDSIGQGRVWTGTRGLSLGLADKIGGLQDAIDCAARMAKTTDYRLKEFPEPKNFFDQLFGDYRNTAKMKAVKEELGDDGFKIYNSLKQVKQLFGIPQTRMPYEMQFDY